MNGLSLDQMQQVQHVACMAVLAMCARGVAAAEFESSPETSALVIRVSRDSFGGELPVDIEFQDAGSQPIGGLSL